MKGMGVFERGFEACQWESSHLAKLTDSLPDALPSRAGVAATMHERNNAFAICSRYLGQGWRESEHRLEKVGIGIGVPSDTHVCLMGHDTRGDVRRDTGCQEVDV